MALAYDSRRATRDVDALFKPHGIVHEEALAVAAVGLHIHDRTWVQLNASLLAALTVHRLAETGHPVGQA